MDLKARQLASPEQEAVLRALAESAARPGCNFLEVGSWCGDSSVILAKVAARHGGRLYCIDWWKGNPGTELGRIARREDVFRFFWDRMCREGIADTVVPVRGRSDVIAPILAREAFHLVFLDADHRYQGILSDIQQYAHLVSGDRGILCGHDCEGRLADYDREFLEAGKDVDYHESVHCGVVLAVATSFERYSIHHSIWSVARGTDGWEPTTIDAAGISTVMQSPPPVIGYSRRHRLLRYGNRVYALPHEMGAPDIRDDNLLSDPRVVSAASVEEVLARIQEEVLSESAPQLVYEGDYGFNIVRYASRYYALDPAAGPLDVLRLTDDELAELQQRRQCSVHGSLRQARRAVAAEAFARVSRQVGELQKSAEECRRQLAAMQETGRGVEARHTDLESTSAFRPVSIAARLVAEGCRGFNIVAWQGRFYCLAQSLGPLDFERLAEQQLQDWQACGHVSVHDSLEQAMLALGQRHPATIELMEESK